VDAIGFDSRVALQAVSDTMPLAVAVIPWGVLTGALGLQVGLSALQAQLMSLLVFAGAAQLSAMTLMAGSSSLLAIFASTFVISSRHLLYSVVFRRHVDGLPLRWRLSIGFVLTDEMFAVSESHTSRTGVFSPLFALVSGVTFYLAWNLATLAGILAGSTLSDLDALGLDFAIVATFIAMTFDQIRRLPIVVCVLVSGVAAVVLKPVFNDSYLLIAALLGMLFGFLAETYSPNPDRGEA
jgi:4-azaleucine resistance transporter AzlC